MNHLFCDFHIHIGRALGKPVKMAAAPSLTLENVISHAREQKGLDIITIIDGVCSSVQTEVEEYIRAGKLMSLPGGGYLCENGLVLLLGSEIEIGGPSGGAAHFGCWFRDLDTARDFSQWLATVQKNISLSSQRARCDAFTLQREVRQRGGLFIVHHAFTPHKGLYGNCVTQMKDMLDRELVDALELGLSADTDMADCLSELEHLSFLSNSDAHSLPKIGREYNQICVDARSFDEVRKALLRIDGRAVTANYGLHPALGKYHRTYCRDCGALWEEGSTRCICGGNRHVMGVYDRLLQVRDKSVPHSPSHRPPYIHQIPLEFIPGLGPKLRQRLLDAFGTEMAILHTVTPIQLQQVVGNELAQRIVQSRNGELRIESGGGGIYGRIRMDS